mgnify:CR=1 FL=1
MRAFAKVTLPGVRLEVEMVPGTTTVKNVEILATDAGQWALAAVVRSEKAGPRTIQFGLALCQRTDVCSVIREIESIMHTTLREDLARQGPPS